MTDDVRADVLERLKNEANRMFVKSRTLEHISQRVKRENRNIRKILNTCLSAYTDSPNNMAYVSESSTGKTYLVENVTSYFPDQDVITLRSVSPKAFSRLRGTLVFKEYTNNGTEYRVTLQNKFTKQNQTVGQYLEYLKSEIESKDNTGNREYLSELAEEKSVISEGLYTMIDFTNKILVLLERPPEAFWKDMLTVASHDKYYQESMFVEGEGRKYTKKIVYRGFPAIIFCTSRDKDLAWKDLETRFEIAQPDQSHEKFTEAIDQSLKEEFEISETDTEKSRIRDQIGELVKEIKTDRPKPYIPEPQEIRKAFLGDSVERAELMREFPRIVGHIIMNALWNYRSRVVFSKGENNRVLVAADDFRELKEQFSDSELNATLHGLTETLYIFLKDVLVPACQVKDIDNNLSITSKPQSEICNFLAKSNSLKSGKSKASCTRYLSSLRDRGIIQTVSDDKDKRKSIVIPMVDQIKGLSLTVSESIEKLVSLYGKLLPEHIGSLLKRNFRAFHKKAEIVSDMYETYSTEGNLPDSNKSENAENNDFPITEIMSISGYSPYVFKSDETISTNFVNSGNPLKQGIMTKSTEMEKFKNRLFSKDETIFLRLRFNNDLPAIAWQIEGKNKTYRFRKNDIAHVPVKLARILIDRGQAIEVKTRNADAGAGA